MSGNAKRRRQRQDGWSSGRVPEEVDLVWCEHAPPGAASQLQRLADLADAVLEARRHLEEQAPALVAGAREGGASWRQVGIALGVTGQAVCQRYARG